MQAAMQQPQQQPRCAGLAGPLVVDSGFGWRLGCGIGLTLVFTRPLVASGIHGLFSNDVQRRMRYGHGDLYRIDLQLAGGKACVDGQMVKSLSEVTALVDAVEAGLNPWWPLQQR